MKSEYVLSQVVPTTATERDKLIAANYAFAAALKQALRSGKVRTAFWFCKWAR